MPAELWADPDRGVAGYGEQRLPLTRQEVAVLAVLLAAGDRVVSRRELSRGAGLQGLSERRCESLLVRIRRVLPAGSVRTVRSRGWSLAAADN